MKGVVCIGRTWAGEGGDVEFCIRGLVGMGPVGAYSILSPLLCG